MFGVWLLVLGFVDCGVVWFVLFVVVVFLLGVLFVLCVVCVVDFVCGRVYGEGSGGEVIVVCGVDVCGFL